MTSQLWQYGLGMKVVESVDEIEEFGYCLIRQTLSSAQVATARRHLDGILSQECAGILRTGGVPYGVRNLLQLWPQLIELVRVPPVLDLIRRVIGEEAGVVRALMFDKPPEASWTLPWHRDRTIAVKQHLPGLCQFSNPTHKANVPHLIAPNSLLEEMLTLRFALDPMREENGPLTVLPGSHRVDTGKDGDLESDSLASQCQRIVTVACDAGDVFVMRPLLAHSSQKSFADTQLRRRVVHIELSGSPDLPEGLHWNEFVSVADTE